MTKSKQCPHCSATKELSAFMRCTCAKLGVSSWCKDCIKIAGKDYRLRRKKHRKQYLRDWREAHPEVQNLTVRRYQTKNRATINTKAMSAYYKKIDYSRLKARAHAAVRRALKSSTMIKPLTCLLCGIVTRVRAHHYDYSKQLEVSWLCASCHGYVHVSLKEGD